MYSHSRKKRGAKTIPVRHSNHHSKRDFLRRQRYLNYVIRNDHVVRNRDCYKIIDYNDRVISKTDNYRIMDFNSEHYHLKQYSKRCCDPKKEIIEPVSNQDYKEHPDKWNFKSNKCTDFMTVGSVYWFRALKGWIWTLNVRDAQKRLCVIKYGYIKFIKEEMKIWNNYSYMPRNDCSIWFRIRQIQTFLCCLKQLRCDHFLNKDVIKKIYSLLSCHKII